MTTESSRTAEPAPKKRYGAKQVRVTQPCMDLLADLTARLGPHWAHRPASDVIAWAVTRAIATLDPETAKTATGLAAALDAHEAALRRFRAGWPGEPAEMPR